MRSFRRDPSFGTLGNGVDVGCLRSDAFKLRTDVSENSYTGELFGMFVKVMPVTSAAVRAFGSECDSPALDIVNSAIVTCLVDPESERTPQLLAVTHAAVEYGDDGTAVDARLVDARDRLAAGDLDHVAMCMHALDVVPCNQYVANYLTERGAVDIAGREADHAVAPVLAFVRWYVGMSEQFEFTHNDMHARNVVYDANTRTVKLVDFGRAWFRGGDAMLARIRDEGGPDVSAALSRLGLKSRHARLYDPEFMFWSVSGEAPWVNDVVSLAVTLMTKVQDRVLRGAAYACPVFPLVFHGRWVASLTRQTKPNTLRLLALRSGGRSADNVSDLQAFVSIATLAIACRVSRRSIDHRQPQQVVKFHETLMGLDAVDLRTVAVYARFVIERVSAP